MANFNVSSFTELQTALASSDTDIHITITADFSITSQIQIPAGKSVSITSDSTKHRLSRGVTDENNKIKKTLADGGMLW
ncbi:MAG: hypothetical protein LBM87_01255 [Ruminococcus sp.]|jgi:hypothetical protein|nr:hypothetical protein [Ruminococcus sp.]